jgi:hypothetical protein
MKKFYIATLLAYSLFVLHVVEEILREAGETFDSSVLMPLILYPIALMAMYLNKKWGFWLAFILNILLLILSSAGHFNPDSHDFVRATYEHWGGSLGVLAGGLAVALPITALVAALKGIKILRSSERM